MSSKGNGILATIIYHLALIILLYMTGFSTPLPLPAEQGILINFGNSNEGTGLSEPSINTSAYTPPSTPQPTPQTEQTPLTQDTEEAPSLPIPPKKKKETPKETPKPTEKPKTEQPEQDIKPQNEQQQVEEQKPEQKVNKKALFVGKKENGSNTGEGETGKAGNQGSTEGSVDSGNRTGSTGGNGTGGSGISATLKGRSALSLPKPKYPSLKEGKVVVRVKVDREGNVIEAIGGQKDSSTNDTELVLAAEKAALSAKFNVKADAQAFQIGYITYVFRLQ